jgi:hypothetical protein
MGNDASFDLEKLLERLQNRHGFLQLFGKGLGYSALVAALPAYGSSSSSSDDDPLAPAPTPKVAVPKADPDGTLEADIQGLFPLTMQAPVQLLEPEGTHTFVSTPLDHKNGPGYPAIKAGIQVCLSHGLEKSYRVCVPWCCATECVSHGAGHWKISDRRQSSATISLLESGTEDAWLLPLTPVISLQDKRLAGLDNCISKRLGYSF